MWTLVGQIVFCLFIALVIGLVIASILQNVRLGRRLTVMESSWQSRSDSHLFEIQATRQQLQGLMVTLEELNTASMVSEQKLEYCRTLLDGHVSTLQSLEARDVELRELTVAVNRLQQLPVRIEEVWSHVKALESEFQSRLRQADAAVGGVSTPLRTPVSAPAAAEPAAAEASDDLKQIRGIGPVIERILHGQGVYSFRQIADWTAEDVDRISRKLGSFRDRIEREHWIQSARMLQQSKSGPK